MLITQVKTYIEIRQTLGYKLRETKRELNLFAKFMEQRKENHINTVNAFAWANLAPSPYARERRMRHIVQLANYLSTIMQGHFRISILQKKLKNF